MEGALLGLIFTGLVILTVGLILARHRSFSQAEKALKEAVDSLDRSTKSFETLSILIGISTIRLGFGLSKVELEGLLGIDLKELTSWKENGPPPGVFQKMKHYTDLLPKLESYVQPGLLPQVIRRPSIGLGGKTILDLLKEGREQEVFEYLERLLEYGSTE